MLMILEQAIAAVPLGKDGRGKTHDGSFIFEIFAKAKIDHNSVPLAPLAATPSSYRSPFCWKRLTHS
jgi:hypothetical protein